MSILFGPNNAEKFGLQDHKAVHSEAVLLSVTRTLQEVSPEPVWTHPDQPIKAARLLLDGFSLPALLVVSDAGDLFVLRREDVLLATDQGLVRDYMEPAPTAFDLQTPIRKAAQVMLNEGVDFVPVLQDGKPLGLVTSRMLLRSLLRSWDPLTGLSWSNVLREWGIDQIENGQEISVIFIDLDDFGLFNKQHGHIVGDEILVALAAKLNALTPADSVLVRYGGDEFAIGTLLDSAETKRLALDIERAAREIAHPALSSGLRLTTGVSGGKRTSARETEKAALIVDDLINLASKDCQARKTPNLALTFQEREEVQSNVGPYLAASESDANLELLVAAVDQQPQGRFVTVTIKDGKRLGTGFFLDHYASLERAAAHAALSAIEQARPEISVKLHDAILSQPDPNMRVFTVIGTVHRQGENAPFSYSTLLGEDQVQGAAQAALQGVQEAITELLVRS